MPERLWTIFSQSIAVQGPTFVAFSLSDFIRQSRQESR
jgi:hypothetical protein